MYRRFLTLAALLGCFAASSLGASAQQYYHAYGGPRYAPPAPTTNATGPRRARATSGSAATIAGTASTTNGSAASGSVHPTTATSGTRVIGTTIAVSTSGSAAAGARPRPTTVSLARSHSRRGSLSFFRVFSNISKLLLPALIGGVSVLDGANGGFTSKIGSLSTRVDSVVENSFFRPLPESKIAPSDRAFFVLSRGRFDQRLMRRKGPKNGLGSPVDKCIRSWREPAGPRPD